MSDCLLDLTQQNLLLDDEREIFTNQFHDYKSEDSNQQISNLFECKEIK